MEPTVELMHSPHVLPRALQNSSGVGPVGSDMETRKHVKHEGFGCLSVCACACVCVCVCVRVCACLVPRMFGAPNQLYMYNTCDIVT